MVTTRNLGLALLLSSAAACTGGDGTASEDGPTPTFLLVENGEGACATFADASAAQEVFSSALDNGEADVVGIAEARIIEECSGAGGTHVFSSTTASGKRFWMGSHGCWLDLPGNSLDAGIIVGLGSQRAGLIQGEEGWCMNYPGENEVFSTDVSTSAMAWFPSQAEATRFLNAL